MGWKGPQEVTKSSLWHVSIAVFASTRTALKKNYVIAVVQNCLLDLLHAKFFPNICPEALSGSGCTNTQNRASTLLCYFELSQARKLRVLRVDHGIVTKHAQFRHLQVALFITSLFRKKLRIKLTT